jgi:hypothetical protein
MTQRSRTYRFVFAIPLKARGLSSDWQLAQSLLRETVHSATRASSSETAVVIACHDEPDLHDVAAPDVHVLRVPFAEPEAPSQGGRDKATKRRFIGAWICETAASEEVDVMFLDADDLVHKDLVEWVSSRTEPAHVVETGYILNMAAGLLQNRRQSFHKTCGSSFVCRFRRNELPTSWDDLASPFSQFGASPDQRGHQDYDIVASELGKPPLTIPFPSVIYRVNHAESLWASKSQERRPVLATDLVRPRVARRLLTEEFSSPDLARDLGGELGFAAHFAAASASRARARLARIVR